jgi:hypothetical protein
MINIEGAFDFHVHTAPSLFERPYSGARIAEEARRQGMHGFVIKHHFEPSVGRAIMVQEQYDDLVVLGGVVLNRHVGGLNPFAVETAIKMGGKIVWFPTCDAQNHLDYFGNTSSYDTSNTGDGGPRLVGGSEGFERITKGPGITVLDDDGNLSVAARDVIDICVRHGVIIATAHLSRDETFAVDRYAHSQGHSRLLLGHALWKPLGLSMDDLKALRDLGVTIEFAASISLPIPCHASPRQVVEAIYELGPDHCILSSDAGAAVYPIPPEALRMYVQSLVDTGLDASDAVKMMSDNPLRLAGIEQ